MSEGKKIDQLQAWVADAKAEIAKINGELGPLHARLAAANERLDLTRRLLRLAETEQTGQRAAAHEPPREGRNRESSSQSHDGTVKEPSNALDLEGHVEQILKRSGEAAHIKDLRQALIDDAVPLPGRGDEANIIVRLRRATSRFVRVGRGMYALAEWGLPEARPKRVVRKRRRQ